ncbi:hypothetical protein TNCV_4302921 [Trichonephila clavipes]|nr:hypothetical protein TNCV_4302921 [Trichonephila clavipes]
MVMVINSCPVFEPLVPQKFSVEEELMHVKHVEVKSPHVGVMWKFGRGVISSEHEKIPGVHLQKSERCNLVRLRGKIHGTKEDMISGTFLSNKLHVVMEAGVGLEHPCPVYNPIRHLIRCCAEILSGHLMDVFLRAFHALWRIPTPTATRQF